MAGKIAVFQWLREKQFNKKTIVALLGILLISSLPIFRGYLPSMEGAERFRDLLVSRRPGSDPAVTGLLILWGIQILTVMVSYCSFDKMPLVGTLLYMLCPYRLYIAYDKMDPAELFVWAFLPLSISLLIRKRAEGEKMAGRWIRAGIGFVILPMSWRFLQTTAATAPEETFWGGGYVFGQFFTLFSYLEDHPGLGLGILLGTAYLFYEGIGEDRKISETGKVYVFAGLVLMILSLRRFPWYVLIRVIPGLGVLLAPLDTAGTFAGLSAAVLCFSASSGMAEAYEKEEGYRKTALFVLVIALALLQGIFMQNEYLYFQYPLE